MLLWIIFATLTASAVAFTLAPLVRRPAASATATARDVYRDQLKEIETQVSAGLISPSEGEAARAEIGRRLLAFESAPPAAAQSRAVSKQSLHLIGFALAATITTVALGLYIWLGSPELPGRPFIDRQDERDAVAFEQMVAEVEQRVAADPNDVPGRRILARVYIAQRRLPEAVKLYDQMLVVLGEGAQATDLSEAAAAQMFAEGKPSGRSRLLIDQALKKNPKDSLARHLSAEIKYQSGDTAAAIAQWEALVADLKPDEPIRGKVEKRLAQAREAKPKPQ